MCHLLDCIFAHVGQDVMVSPFLSHTYSHTYTHRHPCVKGPTQPVPPSLLYFHFSPSAPPLLRSLSTSLCLFLSPHEFPNYLHFLSAPSFFLQNYIRATLQFSLLVIFE